jgi:hypothetical protein
MSIFRIKRFTKDSDENKSLSSKDKWANRGLIAGAVASGYGADYLSSKVGKGKQKKIIENLLNGEFSKDSTDAEGRKLLEELKKSSKDSVHIIDHPLMVMKTKDGRKLTNSFYNPLPTASGKGLASEAEAKRIIDELKKKYPDGLPKSPTAGDWLRDPKKAEKLTKELDEASRKMMKLGPHVNLGVKNPAILAHELGHAEIQQNFRKGDQTAIRKLADHVGQSIPFKTVGNLVANPVTAGVHSAKRGWEVDENDDNKVKFNKKSLILPAIQAGIVLSHPLYEHGASKRGLRMLKELGASKEYLKKSEDMLIGNNSALSTYKLHAGRRLLGNLGGYGAGLAIGRGRAEMLKDKKDDNGEYIIKRR